MDMIHSSDLKTIMHSKRANIYYLEHCRVLVNGGRVEYVTEQGQQSLYWNIPIANTTCILLGTGTSLTQAAVRELSRAGVMIGFCGGGGTPLFSSTESEFACQFFSPQSEYRPTEYLQSWCQFWFDDERRLQAAKLLQQTRLNIISECWPQFDWDIDKTQLAHILTDATQQFTDVDNSQALLAAEGRISKRLYSMANQLTLQDDKFKREQGTRGKSHDPANQFLDHGNYLAYGLGATACWVLGLPHGLAILHGKTRRGGLVFDAADIIKDGIVLPQAFLSAKQGDSEKEFRMACIAQFAQLGALDRIIDTLKQIADQI
ncbi:MULTISPECIES: type I-F CRISPR-associated endonuclease Cas1f [unclassified Gilliamella]|uniref:type I-F CRISPR-associated endonuclease Cas1f n=1 Tax=unclassified Gilliamella TaxID=2685620 RepID=UPI00080EAA76|nr:type I-F CRISPR-associated endonuclease Cas1f [Gilliamella apicola]MCO6559883.1 type I-F CRISPR-associated endonuclease Cas1 [Gilliamella sp.]OCG33306.1 subtype I-F CRISPR-associated endonuclease Cas1 [Gilliamella apicola]OCG48921.1 subtype I-F CRISPR-associated endonuclease Cas1 [Gilliamella apicola]OCG50463.1 subtype I-F CRISPR-associated endonuclease Cas1 [Gilliamella apicola]